MLYLTLYKDGKPMPEGAKSSRRDSGLLRYQMLAGLLEGMGYEVSFTHENPATVKGGVAAGYYLSVEAR